MSAIRQQCPVQRSRQIAQLTDQVERWRAAASSRIDEKQKAYFGQFLTPMPVAAMMASLLRNQSTSLHILDAGAGIGSLTAAGVAELCRRATSPCEIVVTAYEIDDMLAEYLDKTLMLCRQVCEQNDISFSYSIIQNDFIGSAVDQINGNIFASVNRAHMQFDCALLNPPYRKIHARSAERKLLRQLGMETSNLYAGFLAAAIHLLKPHGELIAITPRSFCNGPYFRPFRTFFLHEMALRHIHVFDSRQTAFADDAVLQENIIVHAAKEQRQARAVAISSGRDAQESFANQRSVAFTQVVYPDDPESFIHIAPDVLDHEDAQRLSQLPCKLSDFGFTVSTGRVVDFRARELLSHQPEEDTVPLIYPMHLAQGFIVWPKVPSRKANYIQTRRQDLLIPNENYVLVKRFTTKEEKRRVVASVYDAAQMSCERVGFENHLNHFHAQGRGLALELAKGLAAYLNSTIVDRFFRQFNGHTQVNATDLRNLPYPSLDQLRRLGMQIGTAFPSQAELDDLVEQELFCESNDGNRTVSRHVLPSLSEREYTMARGL